MHVELGFHVLITLALAERRPELREDFIWVRPEIEDDVEAFHRLQII